MEIAITGSSGLIGTELRRSLGADGHRVVRMVRGEPSGPDEVRWDPSAGTVDLAGLRGVDAVVHLAGEGIASGPWTAKHRKRVLDSRMDGTGAIARAVAALDPLPVLLSGSAIGYYGDRGDEELTEESGPGQGFLADVVQAWEAATAPAEEAGARVAHLRSGIVLSTDGGALGTQLPLFKLGLGGKAGPGNQWMSWITIDDEVRAIRFLLDHDLSGPVNLTAPGAVTNAEFTRALGDALHRPTWLRIPRFLGKVPLGVGDLLENLLLISQCIRPGVLTDAGFTFGDVNIEDAFRRLI